MFWIIKYFIITVFISIITTLYLLGATTQGLQLSLLSLASFLPGQLKIEKMTGTVLGGFSLQNIFYQSPDANITVNSLTVHWYPSQLLHGKLGIDTLQLEQPKIKIFTTETRSQDFSLDHFAFLRRITFNKLVIHQLSVEKVDLHLTLTGELKDNWDFHWQIEVPQLSTMYSHCAGSLTGSGSIVGPRLIPTINAALQGNQIIIAQQKINKINAQAHIALQPRVNSLITLSAYNSKIYDHLIKKWDLRVTGNVTFDKETLNTHIQVTLAQQPAILVSASLPHFLNFAGSKQVLAGMIHLNFTELSGLRYFIPDIKDPRGIIQGHFDLGGTLAQPEIAGLLDLRKGEVTIRPLGIQLNDIAIQAHIDKNKMLVLTGGLRSGKGTGKLQGTLNLNKIDFPLNVTLQGNNLKAVDLPKIKGLISPDLKLTFNYPILQLQGKIFIPSANIKLKDFISTVTLPDEIIFVGQSKVDAHNFLLETKLQLEINLGNDIYFSYKDFEANLAGKLLLSQSPNSPATAVGEIHALNGIYTIYGQNLTITTGRLIYTGNLLTNPGLNIEATQKAKSITAASTSTVNITTLDSLGNTEVMAGIRITGTANNPKINLFSIPAGALSQTEILSALGGESAILFGTLSVFNLGTGNAANVTDKFTKMFGLTEFNLGSVQTFNPATNQAETTRSFVIGKQISKKLSLHYSIGIFNPISILNLRYQFNKHWAIQSETSTIDNGADILYTLEQQ
jgi:translocation and assembly module TamB